MCCLVISTCLCFLQFFSWYLAHVLWSEKDAWHDFSFLKFTEVWFVTQDVVYPGECSKCTWEEGIFFWFGWNVLKISMRSISSNVLFRNWVSLLIFCFDKLSIGVSGVLKSIIIVLLSISPFMSDSVCLWRRKWQPTPVFLPGESHGWRSLVGYSSQCRKKSDTTEWLHFT